MPGGGDDKGAPGATGPAGSAEPAAPSAGSAAPTPSASKPATKPAATATATKKPASPVPASSATCDHKMPISPDMIAVYRYTPEGGAHHLIVKHGNWGCGSPDSDGAPFEAVGKETFYPIADTAKITATTPIVESTESTKISLDTLVDWVVAHPGSALVFRYHLGADGAIDTLDEIFVP